MENLPIEMVEHILTLATSKTRADACSVSSTWYNLAVSISVRMSDFPHLYINPKHLRNCDIKYIYRFGDYHLVARLKLIGSVSDAVIGGDDTASLYDLSINFEQAIIGASKSNNLRILNLLEHHILNHDTLVQCVYNVSKRGNLDLLMKFNLSMVGMARGAYEGAAKGGHTNIIKCIHTLGYEADWDKLLIFACMSGNIETVKYAISCGGDSWPDAIWGACRGGNIEIVKLLLEKVHNVRDMDIGDACIHDDPELIQLLLDNGGVFSSDDFNMACYYGNNKILSMILPMHVVVENDLGMVHACEGGHLSTVQLLLQYGVSDYERSFQAACMGGNMDIINMLILLGVTNWNDGLIGAAIAGNYEVAELMISKGATNKTNAWKCAMESNNINIAELLY